MLKIIQEFSDLIIEIIVTIIIIGIIFLVLNNAGDIISKLINNYC